MQLYLLIEFVNILMIFFLRGRKFKSDISLSFYEFINRRLNRHVEAGSG